MEYKFQISVPDRLPRRAMASVLVLVLLAAASGYGISTDFKPGDKLSSQTLKSNFQEIDGRLAALELKASAVAPAGTVVAFAGEAIPDGWKLCNGEAVSRTEYSNLFAALGIAHGGGDGVTTFNLPDYRGRFLRGVDHGAERDPDRLGRTPPQPDANGSGNSGDLVGSVQSDEMRQHRHLEMYLGGSVGGGNAVGCNVNASNWRLDVGTLVPWAGFTDYTGGAENRPSNASVNYIIKI